MEALLALEDGLHFRGKSFGAEGEMRCVISTNDLQPDSLVQKARRHPDMVGQDLVKQVTCHQPYHWKEPTVELFPARKKRGRPQSSRREAPPLKVVAFDFGIKHN